MRLGMERGILSTVPGPLALVTRDLDPLKYFTYVQYTASTLPVKKREKKTLAHIKGTGSRDRY
jgi:hypothetical protein